MKRRFQTVPADGPDGKNNEPNPLDGKRVEITVEREWVTEIWRASPEGGMEKVYEDTGFPELPPPKPTEFEA